MNELLSVTHFKMPETKLKSLYMGKSVEDLKKFYNISEAIKGYETKS